MKKALTFGLLAMAVVTTISMIGIAQTGTQPSAVPSSIGVIDLGKVYQEWNYVVTQTKAIEERHKPRLEAIKARLDDSQKQVAQLRQMNAGTPEYQKLEADIYRIRKGIEVDEGLRQKEQQEEVAKILQDAFKYIKNHTAYIAKSRGISCVIQYNSSEEFKTINPQMNAFANTMTDLNNRNVIWHDETIDLTPLVINQLNGGKASNQSAAAGQTSPAGTTAARTGAIQNR